MKKSLSLILSVLMLLTIIPIYSVTAYATGTDGDFALSEDAVLTIDGPQDWNAVAALSAAGETFDGKTIKLTADIDGASATVNAPLFTILSGSFDGQDHTVKNVTSNGKAIIAEKTTKNKTVTISNLNIESATLNVSANGSAILVGENNANLTITDCSVSSAVKVAGYNIWGVSGLIGVSFGPSTTTVKNTDINSTMTYTGTSSVAFHTDGYSAIVLGWKRADTNFYMDNCNVTGSMELPNAMMGAICGKAMMTTNYTMSVTNTNVDVDVKCTYDAKTHGISSARWGVGGLIGALFGQSDNAVHGGTVIFDKVNVTGDVLNGGGFTGGFIGACYGGETGSNTTGLTMNVTASRCVFNNDITANNVETNDGTAMVIGAWGWRNSTNYFTGTLNISECLVAGSITAPNYANSVGAVFGAFYFYNNANASVNNCAITTKFDDGTMTKETFPTALVVGRSLDTKSTLSVNNCVTTYTGEYYLGGNTHRLYFNGPYVEGYVKYKDDSVMEVTAEKLAAMTKKDDKGFIDSISGQIVGGYIQYTDNYTVTKDGADDYTAYSVRFIALSQLDNPASAGITVTVKDSEGNVVKTFDTLECKAYDALTGYSVGDKTMVSYTATEYGAEKFIAVIIRNIPTGNAYTFEFAPHYETEGGLTMTGKTSTAKFDATGAFVK